MTIGLVFVGIISEIGKLGFYVGAGAFMNKIAEK